MDVINSYIHKVATCVLKTDHPTFKDWAYTVCIRVCSLRCGRSGCAQPWSPSRLDGRNLDTVKRATLDLFADSKVDLARANFTVPDELELDDLSRPEVRQLQRGVWNTKYQLSIRLSPKGREKVIRNTQSEIVTEAIHLASGPAKSRQWQYSVYWQMQASLESHPSCPEFWKPARSDRRSSRRGSKTLFFRYQRAHWPCLGVRGWLGRCWDNPFQLRWNRLYPSMSSQCGSG